MENIHVLLSAKEKEKIKKAAEKEKRSMSNYILTAALEKIERGK